MAINALGLPLQLQASPLQIQDLLGGLNPGDLLKGRVVELLTDGKAVLNLRGQNLVAQLPQGPAPQRGAILDLQVTQTAPAEAGKAAALTLRLLPPAPAAGANAPQAPFHANPLPPQAQLDQALSAARLPLNPVTQQIARTLAQLGVPLSPAALQSAAQAVDGLLNVEGRPAPATAPVLPAPVQSALQQAAQELRLAAQLSPSGPQALALQSALRDVQALLSAPAPSLQAQSSAPASSAPLEPPPQGTSSGPAPQAASTGAAALPPAATTQAPTTPNAAAPAGLPNPAPAQAAVAQAPNVAAFVQALRSAIAQVQAQPQAPALAALAQTLAQVPAFVAPMPAGPAAPLRAQTATGTAPSAAPSSPAAPTSALPLSELTPASVLVQRESVAPLLALAQDPAQPLSLPALRNAVQQQLTQLEDPNSGASQRLLKAVQLQDTQAAPQPVLSAAREALTQVQARLAALPESPAPLTSAQLQQWVAEAQVASPRVPLQSLPVETVAEAVAWLQARELPPQRPLVEAVAVFLQQDHDALPAAQRSLDLAQALPPKLLDAQPALQRALDQARHALQSAQIQPETPGLAQRLQAWAAEQGLSLESRLLQSLPDGAPAVADAAGRPLPEARPALRPALQQLEQALRQAQSDPQAQAPETAGRLQSALHEVQAANRAFSAIPLQAQAAPAFDTVHMPLPVVMGQDLGGQLSVTWRHGRDRQLDEREPVNVAVALNTGSLGTVKVLLQVWKDAASARVLAQDEATAQFLAEGADELRSGFADRTPFKLQALDFAADAGRERPDSPDAPAAPSGGLSLSA